MAGEEERELVEVAFAGNPLEAEMLKGLLETGGIRSLLQPIGINGPQVGYGTLYAGYGGGGQRVMVWDDEAEAARSLLAESLVVGEDGDEPEIANARHLEKAAGGRRPRNYGLIGGYSRIWLVSIGALALAFGAFVLLRSL